MAVTGGAHSPNGEPHPGEILHEDRVERRSWVRRAADVPPTVAWLAVGGGWVPVVRVVIRGSMQRREVTRYTVGNRVLETTILER